MERTVENAPLEEVTAAQVYSSVAAAVPAVPLDKVHFLDVVAVLWQMLPLPVAIVDAPQKQMVSAASAVPSVVVQGLQGAAAAEMSVSATAVPATTAEV